MRKVRIVLAVALVAAALALLPTLASANNSWANYHWSRSSNPFTVNLGNNVDAAKWGGHLSVASTDWSASSVLNSPVVAGGTSAKACRPTAGRVEVCSASYGNTGWLGIASIWASGDHITQGTAKVNDYYHDSPPYNTSSWRQLVLCQEIGHTYGLDHQDEDFNTKTLPGTCMDYTSDPVGSEHPNAHDYTQLETIYAHLDGGGNGEPCRGGPKQCGNGVTISKAPPAFDSVLRDMDQWGRLVDISRDGGQSTFVQDFGGGFRIITHVTWTLEVADEFARHRTSLLNRAQR